jgi:hypothetical protein
LQDKSNAAWGLEKPAQRPGEIPTKVLADPDPFRRLTYRAIVQHLGRVLATPSAEQLETINIVVATTLNTGSAGAIRTCMAHPSDELPDAE